MPLGQEKPPVRVFNLIRKKSRTILGGKISHRISFVRPLFPPGSCASDRMTPQHQNPLSLKGGRHFRCKDFKFGSIWSVKTWPHFQKLLWNYPYPKSQSNRASPRLEQPWYLPQRSTMSLEEKHRSHKQFDQSPLEITQFSILPPQDV